MGLNKQAYEAVCTPVEMRKAPKTIVQAQFSICYNIACALVNGRVCLEYFTAEALKRPDVLSVAARVTPIVDAEFERKFGRNVTPARVEAVIGGKVFSAQVEEAKGGAERPMSSQDNRLKLEDCLSFGGFEPGRATFFEDAINGLENSADVGADIQRMISGVLNR